MSNEDKCCSSDKLALLFGSVLLRLWLAVRAIQTGIEKFAGSKALANKVVEVNGQPNPQGLVEGASVKVYALDAYHGVPAPLMTKFQEEPMMLKFMLPIYDKVLGPSLILFGLAILLGLCTRVSLLLLGLIYVSLTWGLILIKEDGGVAWLGTHMIMIVMALVLVKHDRLVILKKW